MTKKFVLVSLQEKKAKKIAEVISNNTCRKMLDFMASVKDTTESDISKKLNIPISTVHYNMKALLEAKLVKSDEYHYSKKGKEVSHYRLANQYVIIAPEEDKKNLREQLKSLLPITLVAGATASIIRLFSGYYWSSGMETFALAKSADDAVAGGSPSMQDVAIESSRAMADEAVRAPMEPVAQAAQPIMAEPIVEAGETMIASAPSADTAAYGVAEEAVNAAVHETPEMARKAVEAVPSSPPAPMPESMQHITQPSVLDYLSSHIPEILFWFVVGTAIGVGIYFLVKTVRRRGLRKKIKV